MFIKPVFNQIEGRPYRWALQDVSSGDMFERPYFEEHRYVHWVVKAAGKIRTIFPEYANSFAQFQMIRRTHVGFLTTFHKEFYEDGKYVEVWNDPVNYILEDPVDKPEAYDHAEKRIGNYRMGVRRHITHLGGTISDDELDQFEDDEGTPLTTFPFFPPLPEVAFDKPFRSHLISSDVGYVDYIKAAHPDEAAADKYAYRAEQGTGFRRFVYSTDSVKSPLMEYESVDINSVSKVDIKDIETIIDAGVDAAVTGTDGLLVAEQTLLPQDGQDILINFPGWHVVRSDDTGYTIEIFDGAGLANLVSYIAFEKTSGNVELGAGTTTITMTKDGIITIAGAAGLTIDGDITTTGSGGLIIAGNVDIEGTLNVLGVTTHGA